jgi:hypothetical protein
MRRPACLLTVLISLATVAGALHFRAGAAAAQEPGATTSDAPSADSAPLVPALARGGRSDVRFRTGRDQSDAAACVSQESPAFLLVDVLIFDCSFEPATTCDSIADWSFPDQICFACVKKSDGTAVCNASCPGLLGSCYDNTGCGAGIVASNVTCVSCFDDFGPALAGFVSWSAN